MIDPIGVFLWIVLGSAVALLLTWMMIESSCRPPSEVKDPDDSTKSEGSTNWQREIWCRSCKAAVGDDEAMGEFCPGCGSDQGKFWVIQDKRLHRRIWRGQNWQHQYRYPRTSLPDELLSIGHKCFYTQNDWDSSPW